MPRRPDEAYCPHRNEWHLKRDRRKVQPGPCMNGLKALRRKRWHLCGALLFRGLKDFNGYHWTPTYHAGPEMASPELLKCPQCGGALNHDSVLSEEPCT